MLYPLVWQLAVFLPLAAAFETILSESSIMCHRPKLRSGSGLLAGDWFRRLPTSGVTQAIHLDGVDAG